MKIVKINQNNPDSKIIKEAAEVLKSGGLVVYPTDTAYGLGVNAYDQKAVKKLYQVKKRGLKKPTHVICRNWKMIAGICVTNELARKLYEKYCPGPLTLILNKAKGTKFPELLTGGLPTLGVRVPDCKVTQVLSQFVSFPYTTPSANKSGNKTPYSVEQVVESLDIENVGLILDGGKLPDKSPSTIVDLSKKPYGMLREGQITSGDIQATIKNYL